ncbi:MAG: four helix bundle protein [Flavobacteriaceae bacterium]|jgi:four helix bundle protein
MRRAAVSIPSNIAEGADRNTDKELSRFLAIAMGSAFEIETQLMISQDLNLLELEKYNELHVKLEDIIRQMRAFKNILI